MKIFLKSLFLITLFILNVYGEDVTLFGNTADSSNTNEVRNSQSLDSLGKDSLNYTQKDTLTDILTSNAQIDTNKLSANLGAQSTTIDSKSKVSSVEDSSINDTTNAEDMSNNQVESSEEQTEANVNQQTQSISFVKLLQDDNDEVVREYKKALNIYRAGKPRKALEIFKYLLLNYPTHPLASNIQYWIGEIQYVLGNYDEAIESLRNVFLYPYSPKYDDAQFLIVKCYRKMGLIKQALAELETFFYKYPNSEYYKRAKAIYNHLKRVGR